MGELVRQREGERERRVGGREGGTSGLWKVSVTREWAASWLVVDDLNVCVCTAVRLHLQLMAKLNNTLFIHMFEILNQ